MDEGVKIRRVAAVVVTYNGASWIRRCLASLCEPVNLTQVIVVDNRSDDDTADIIAIEFPDVELIRLPENLGFGKGNNIGISRALAHGAEYTLLLNQDAYVLPGTLPGLIAFMDSHPDFGVASPLHCSPDPDSIDLKTYRGYLQTYAANFLCDAALDSILPYYQVRGINAAAWFLRTQIFTRVGGFDPLFFMYGEDDDLLARFELHHVPFALLPRLRIVHLRESPPRSPPDSWWVDISRRADKYRPGLIVRIKNPSASGIHMVVNVIAHGLLEPLAAWLVDHRTRDFLAMSVASVGVLLDVPRIRRHARLCARPGRHYLDANHDSR